MQNKQKLISALNVVIKALESGTVFYNWSEAESCNCGLVVQSLIGSSVKEFSQELNDRLMKNLRDFSEARKIDYNPTWCNLAALYCPLTGIPTNKIFKVLYESGLTREDIGHLEYLSDPEILQRAKIDTKETEKIQKNVTKEVVEEKIEKYGIFNRTRKVKSVIQKVVKEEYTLRYFAIKKNLLKYLKAWVEILQKQQQENIKERILALDGNEYKYKSAEDLATLKEKFLEEQNYVAVKVVDVLISNY